MTNKLITHEEAKQFLLMQERYDKNWHIQNGEVILGMYKYISQQEKKDELLGLKDKTINAYQVYLASKDTQDRDMCNKWSNEIIKLLAKTFTKEKELKEELE